jgi:hypothetical protein
VPASAVEPIAKGADKAEAALAVAQQAIGAFQQALAQSNTREDGLRTLVGAVNETLKAVADKTHEVAPGTKADDGARTAQVIGGIVSGLVMGIAGIFAGKSIAHTAITTPGTTIA